MQPQCPLPSSDRWVTASCRQPIRPRPSMARHYSSSRPADSTAIQRPLHEPTLPLHVATSRPARSTASRGPSPGQRPGQCPGQDATRACGVTNKTVQATSTPPQRLYRPAPQPARTSGPSSPPPRLTSHGQNSPVAPAARSCGGGGAARVNAECEEQEDEIEQAEQQPDEPKANSSNARSNRRRNRGGAPRRTSTSGNSSMSTASSRGR